MRYIFGKWVKDSPLTASDVREIITEASLHRRTCAAYPTDRILRLLGKLRELWINPEYQIRKDVEKTLPEITGFSPEMLSLAFSELDALFNPELLEKKIMTEFRGIPRATGWKYDSMTKTSLNWQPLGTMLHVLSGNVFLVSAGSLVAGLITGNVNILKMSSAEKVFLPRLIESLIDCDEDGVISKTIAVVDFESANSAVVDEFKNLVDGIVVWGGEEAVKAYRNNLPAKTRLIVFGPRLSLAVVTGDGLEEMGFQNTADKLADEISIWDQNACTAPQVCYVEGDDNTNRLARLLASSLDKVSVSLPQGQVDFDAAIEIRKIRTVSEMAESKGEGLLLESRNGLDWTVIIDRDKIVQPSPLYRTIRLVPYDDINDVLSAIGDLRGYIQTVGLVAASRNRIDLMTKLAQSGALRILDPGQMSGGEMDDPHDGAYDLPQFMNLVFSRSLKTGDDYETMDFAAQEARFELINERLRRLIDKARLSEFYRQRLNGVAVETVSDLLRIPVLTREDMEKNSPPGSTALCTGSFEGGYVSRSGGSTGEPKYSIYDAYDWDEMIGNAVRVFRAMGIKKGDRVANCFIVGNLYGSFVSFDHINCRAGVTSFAFGNEVKPEVFIDNWKKFNINVVMGVPSTLIPLLREAKRLEKSFTMPKVLYAGSPLSRIDYDWFKNELGTGIISSVIGANDGGEIAFQCSEMHGAIHHTIDDYNYIEIVDEDDRPVPDGQPGRILITSLLKFAVPLIRYEIGDEGRIIPGKCACGRTMRILEYIGRSDDIITLGLLNIRHRDFSSAISCFPVSEYQIVARSTEKGELLIIRTESENPPGDLAVRIKEAVFRDVAMIKYRVDTGGLADVVVEIAKPGSLPRNPRSEKIKRIVDERV